MYLIVLHSVSHTYADELDECDLLLRKMYRFDTFLMQQYKNSKVRKKSQFDVSLARKESQLSP